MHLDEKVYPISISKNWIAAGRKGVFVGFGATGWVIVTNDLLSSFSFHVFLNSYLDGETGINPDFLQYITLYVIPNERCREVHFAKYKERIHSSILCTYIGNGTGSCRGDSGSVLTVDNRLIGIMSWTVRCKFKLPDQFTRISSFIPWIEAKTHIEHFIFSSIII